MTSVGGLDYVIIAMVVVKLIVLNATGVVGLIALIVMGVAM